MISVYAYFEGPDVAKLVYDYLVGGGYKEAAKKFLETSEEIIECLRVTTRPIEMNRHLKGRTLIQNLNLLVRIVAIVQERVERTSVVLKDASLIDQLLQLLDSEFDQSISHDTTAVKQEADKVGHSSPDVTTHPASRSFIQQPAKPSTSTPTRHNDSCKMEMKWQQHHQKTEEDVEVQQVDRQSDHGKRRGRERPKKRCLRKTARFSVASEPTQRHSRSDAAVRDKEDTSMEKQVQINKRVAETELATTRSMLRNSKIFREDDLATCSRTGVETENTSTENVDNIGVTEKESCRNDGISTNSATLPDSDVLPTVNVVRLEELSNKGEEMCHTQNSSDFLISRAWSMAEAIPMKAEGGNGGVGEEGRPSDVMDICFVDVNKHCGGMSPDGPNRTIFDLAAPPPYNLYSAMPPHRTPGGPVAMPGLIVCEDSKRRMHDNIVCGPIMKGRGKVKKQTTRKLGRPAYTPVVQRQHPIRIAPKINVNDTSVHSNSPITLPNIIKIQILEQDTPSELPALLYKSSEGPHQPESILPTMEDSDDDEGKLEIVVSSDDEGKPKVLSLDYESLCLKTEDLRSPGELYNGQIGLSSQKSPIQTVDCYKSAETKLTRETRRTASTSVICRFSQEIVNKGNLLNSSDSPPVKEKNAASTVSTIRYEPNNTSHDTKSSSDINLTVTSNVSDKHMKQPPSPFQSDGSVMTQSLNKRKRKSKRVSSVISGNESERVVESQTEDLDPKETVGRKKSNIFGLMGTTSVVAGRQVVNNCNSYSIDNVGSTTLSISESDSMSNTAVDGSILATILTTRKIHDNNVSKMYCTDDSSNNVCDTTPVGASIVCNSAGKRKTTGIGNVIYESRTDQMEEHNMNGSLRQKKLRIALAKHKKIKVKSPRSMNRKIDTKNIIADCLKNAKMELFGCDTSDLSDVENDNNDSSKVLSQTFNLRGIDSDNYENRIDNSLLSYTGGHIAEKTDWVEGEIMASYGCKKSEELSEKVSAAGKCSNSGDDEVEIEVSPAPKLRDMIKSKIGNLNSGFEKQDIEELEVCRTVHENKEKAVVIIDHEKSHLTMQQKTK